MLVLSTEYGHSLEYFLGSVQEDELLLSFLEQMTFRNPTRR